MFFMIPISGRNTIRYKRKIGFKKQRVVRVISICRDVQIIQKIQDTSKRCLRDKDILVTYFTLVSK